MDLRGIVEFFKDVSKYLIVIAVVILLSVFVVGLQQVIGPSMNPTLTQGDIVLVNKLLYRIKDIQRNDIIVLSQNEKYMVKRVVGLPGETVEYKDNYVLVNDKKYNETFTIGNTNDFSIKDLGYTVIPEDMYLVLGDNREDSQDSRNFGLVNKKNIIGKAWVRIWPFNEISFIK